MVAHITALQGINYSQAGEIKRGEMKLGEEGDAERQIFVGSKGEREGRVMEERG